MSDSRIAQAEVRYHLWPRRLAWLLLAATFAPAACPPMLLWSYRR
jgi:hypothetical protein